MIPDLGNAGPGGKKGPRVAAGQWYRRLNKDSGRHRSKRKRRDNREGRPAREQVSLLCIR